jgi:hypothetical protein
MSALAGSRGTSRKRAPVHRHQQTAIHERRDRYGKVDQGRTGSREKGFAHFLGHVDGEVAAGCRRPSTLPDVAGDLTDIGDDALQL